MKTRLVAAEPTVFAFACALAALAVVTLAGDRIMLGLMRAIGWALAAMS